MDQLRSYYSQFGLGVSTGIELDNETTGMIGSDYSLPGKALDLAIGQYDTYTPLQLVQYTATIANNGYRLKPQLVKEIREPELDTELKGSVQKSVEPEVLNRITMSQEEINAVKAGFRRVMTNGTAKNEFSSEPYKPAGKTGTAETYNQGVAVRNSNLIAYAPYDNPEVAMAVVVPSSYVKGPGHALNRQLGQAALRAYFDLKKKGEQELGEKEKQQEEHNQTND